MKKTIVCNLQPTETTDSAILKAVVKTLEKYLFENHDIALLTNFEGEPVQRHFDALLNYLLLLPYSVDIQINNAPQDSAIIPKIHRWLNFRQEETQDEQASSLPASDFNSNESAWKLQLQEELKKSLKEFKQSQKDSQQDVAKFTKLPLIEGSIYSFEYITMLLNSIIDEEKPDRDLTPADQTFIDQCTVQYFLHICVGSPTNPDLFFKLLNNAAAICGLYKDPLWKVLGLNIQECKALLKSYQGEFALAIVEYTKLYDQLVSLYGKEYFFTMRAEKNINHEIFSQGKISHSERNAYAQKRANMTKGIEKWYGENTIEAAQAIDYEAFFLSRGDTADKEAAIKLYLVAKEMYEANKQENIALYASVLNNLASAYLYLKRFDEAKPLYEKSLNIYDTLYGKNSPHCLIILNNLAVFFSEIKDFNNALLFYKRLFGLLKNTVGIMHYKVASCLGNIGSLYNREKNYEEAKKFHLWAVHINRKCLDKEHPHMATALNNLAAVCYALGHAALEQKNIANATENFVIAEASLKESLSIRVLKLGEDHPDTLATKKWIKMLAEAKQKTLIEPPPADIFDAVGTPSVAPAATLAPVIVSNNNANNNNNDDDVSSKHTSKKQRTSSNN